MLLSEINELNKANAVSFSVPEFAWRGDTREVVLVPGDNIEFNTRFTSGTGTVLDIDHGNTYPIKIEYTGAAGDKRIESFAPSEFKSVRFA